MNRVEEITTADAAATERVGETLAERVKPGDVILLEGDLAAGKTTLVKGLVRGLGGDPESVSSPTFVLVQSYPCNGPAAVVHHVDLYRLPDEVDALRGIGIGEFIADPEAVVALEWPREALAAWLPRGLEPVRVALHRLDDDTRRIEISSA